MSNGPQRRLESTNTVEAERESPRPGIATATQHSDAEFQDVNPVFSKLPPEAVVAIAEALVARGLIQTLGNFNATSKGVNKVTLPTLWRTVVWKPRKEAVEEKTARWKRIMVNAKGSRYIQFIVDRDTYVPNTTRDLPEIVETSTAFIAGTLKGYIARFNDTILPRNIQNDDPKVLTHLLPGYQPISEDFISLRHALYQIHPENIPAEDIYYLFLLHSPDEQPRRALPPSLENHPRFLPSMPYSLECVYVMPKEDDFVDGDRQQLAGVIFDFLAAISHKADPSWNAYQGRFASWPEWADRDCGGFIKLMWLIHPESGIIGAQCTARALETLSGSSRPWIQLSYGIHTRIANHQVKEILEIILPFYLERAPFRFHPPSHGIGDVVIKGPGGDMIAALKRVLPNAAAHPPEKRDVVGYYIKRCPRGQTFKELQVDLSITHDEYLVFYEQFRGEAALAMS